MIVTFTKLFVIRIVASVRSESSRNRAMLLSRTSFSVSNCAMSPGDKLKNAISEPLANPDTNNKPTTNTIATATPKDGGKTYISDKVSVI